MSGDLNVGTLLSIPCEIREGAVPNERFVRCDLGESVIEGAVPQGFTDLIDKSVIAVVYEILQNMISIYFNGDIFRPGNPVAISRKVVEEKCKIVDS